MHEEIRRIAKRIVWRYGTCDPFLIARYEGIFTLRSDLPPAVNGLYQAIGGRRIIHVREALSEPRSTAVCAHELGHALLHPTENSLLLSENPLYLPGRPERDAELFSFYLLDGGTAVRTYGTLERTAAVTGLSENALLLGIRDSGRTFSG